MQADGNRIGEGKDTHKNGACSNFVGLHVHDETGTTMSYEGDCVVWSFWLALYVDFMGVFRGKRIQQVVRHFMFLCYVCLYNCFDYSCVEDDRNNYYNSRKLTNKFE